MSPKRRPGSGRKKQKFLLSAAAVLLVLLIAFFSGSLDELLPEDPFDAQYSETVASTADSSSAAQQESSSAEDASVPDGTLEVRFIDVGQADCILVQCEGENLLIDAGDQGSYDVISGTLDRLGVSRLDYVVATHPHADHIGSMAKVILNYEIGTLILPEIPDAIMPTTRTFEKMMDAIEETNCTVQQAEPLDVFTVGGAEVTILGPAGEYNDLNDISVVCRLVYGDVSFLFTGDAEATAESDILSLGSTLRSTVLKMGHHGSSTSTSLPFWEAVDPLYCVISCGEGNDYGHPHQETLDLLDEYQIIPYRTDTMGTILFHVENGKISITTGE